MIDSLLKRIPSFNGAKLLIVASANQALALEDGFT